MGRLCEFLKHAAMKGLNCIYLWILLKLKILKEAGWEIRGQWQIYGNLKYMTQKN